MFACSFAWSPWWFLFSYFCICIHLLLNMCKSMEWTIMLISYQHTFFDCGGTLMPWPTDKSGGAHWYNAGDSEFLNFVYCSSFFPILIKGNHFSWCNNHTNPSSRVYEALVRGLASLNLFSTYPSTTIKFLPMSGSDHNCITLWSYWREQREMLWDWQLSPSQHWVSIFS